MAGADYKPNIRMHGSGDEVQRYAQEEYRRFGVEGSSHKEARPRRPTWHLPPQLASDVALDVPVPRRARTVTTKKASKRSVEAWNAVLKRQRTAAWNPDPDADRDEDPESPNSEREQEVAEVLFDLANMFGAKSEFTGAGGGPDLHDGPSGGPGTRRIGRARDSSVVYGDDQDAGEAAGDSGDSTEQSDHEADETGGRYSRRVTRRSGQLDQTSDSGAAAGTAAAVPAAARHAVLRGHDGLGSHTSEQDGRLRPAVQREPATAAGGVAASSMPPKVAPAVPPPVANYYHSWMGAMPAAAHHAAAAAAAAAAQPVAGQPVVGGDASAAAAQQQPAVLRKYSKRCANHVYIARFIEWKQGQQRLEQQATGGSAAGSGPSTEAVALGGEASGSGADASAQPAIPHKVVPSLPAAAAAAVVGGGGSAAGGSSTVPKAEWVAPGHPAAADGGTGVPPVGLLPFGSGPQPLSGRSVQPRGGGTTSAGPMQGPPGGPSAALQAHQLAQLQAQLMHPGAAALFFPGGPGGPLPGAPFVPHSAAFAHMPPGAAQLSLFGPPPFGLGAFPPGMQQLAASQAAVSAGLASQRAHSQMMQAGARQVSSPTDHAIDVPPGDLPPTSQSRLNAQATLQPVLQQST